MCGIVYAQDFNGNPVNNKVLDQFDSQRSRGTEGFGLFDGTKMHLVRAAKENKILKWFVRFDSSLILFHHRKPTSTINVKRAAHPFTTRDYFGDTQYVMVHNGHISNDYKLYDKHVEMGIEYQSLLQDETFNDSESLLWDLALTLEGKQPDLTAYGGIAFICMKLVKGKLDKLYFGRNSNPLNLYRDKDGITLSSEGDGEAIQADHLYTYNYKLNRLTKKEFEIPRWLTTESKVSNYNDYYDDEYWMGRYNDSAYHQNVSKIVRRQLSLSDVDRNGRPIYDFDREGNPVYVDWADYLANRYPEDSYDDEIEEYESYSPTKSETESCAMNYIMKASGNFEQAYWLAEIDYEKAMDTEDSYDMKQSLLLEKALEYLALDEEYVNEYSISSLWEALGE